MGEPMNAALAVGASPMRFAFHYERTADDFADLVVAAHRHAGTYWRSARGVVWWAGAGFVGVFIIQLLRGYSFASLVETLHAKPLIYAGLAVAAGSLAVYFLMARLYRYYARSFARRAQHTFNAILAPVRVAFHEQGIRSEVEGAATELAWPEVKRIEARGDRLLIIYANGCGDVIPARAFRDDAEREALVAFLRANAPSALGESR
jgi:hypothetical protein